MKQGKIYSLVLASIALSLISGCVERRVVVRERVPVLPAGRVVEVVPEAPPPPQQEVIVEAPGPDYVWIGGYWVWQGRWVWSPGHWVARPYVGAVFAPGHWIHRGHRWAWEPGHWRRAAIPPPPGVWR